MPSTLTTHGATGPTRSVAAVMGTAARRCLPTTPRSAMVWSAALSAALTAPLFLRVVRTPSVVIGGVSDFAIHLRLARDIEFWPVVLTVPHPVFHVLVRALDGPVGTVASPVIVLSLAVAVTAAAATHLAMQDAYGRPGLGPLAAMVFGLVFFLSESPSVVLQALGWIDPAGYTPIHIWGNPTETVGVATSFVLVPLLARFLTATEHSELRRLAPWVASVTVVATLAKPSMTLALMPAVLVYLVVTRSFDRAELVRVARWFLAPAGAIVLWQYWFLTTGQSPEVTSGVTIDPFALVGVYGWFSNGPAFWIGPALVLLTAVAGRGRFLSQPEVRLTLIGLGFSMAVALLLRETGERAFHGNLAKSGYFCWVVLWLLAARFWAFELRDGLMAARSSVSVHTRRGQVVRVALVTCVSAIVVVSGVLAHLEALGVLDRPVAETSGP